MLPIRKTSPNTVALTSFYGKNFIRRSEKVAQDRPKWLVNEIIRRGIDLNDVSVTDLRFADVFDPLAVTPRDYSSVSMRLSGFTAGDTIFNFDYSKRNEIYSEAAVKHCEESNLIPVGLSRNALMAMDKFNTLYQISNGKIEERGTLPEVLGFDLAKEPKEFTELSMMGKDVPLAIVLCYYQGLRKALKKHKVPFEVYEPAQRITTTNNDLVLRFSDAKMVISPQTPEQGLIFNGLIPYVKIMRDYKIRDMDKKDVYLNLIQKNGLTNRYLNELDLMDTMFVDPITERILKKMGEPITFKGLLRRANEMLTNDAHPRETDAFNQHIFGHQRVAGAVYTEMVRSVREYRNKPGTRKKLEMQQNAVWQLISQDPSVMPASNANPIQSMKEADVVTFGGEGGRSRRSMVKHTREFLESDIGLISESTVDSGDVAITSYLSDNPIFDDIDGLIKNTPKKDLKTNQVMSSTSMLAPCSMYDRRIVIEL